jgi:hypothetical protein
MLSTALPSLIWDLFSILTPATSYIRKLSQASPLGSSVPALLPVFILGICVFPAGLWAPVSKAEAVLVTAVSSAKCWPQRTGWVLLSEIESEFHLFWARPSTVEAMGTKERLLSSFTSWKSNSKRAKPSAKMQTNKQGS